MLLDWEIGEEDNDNNDEDDEKNEEDKNGENKGVGALTTDNNGKTAPKVTIIAVEEYTSKIQQYIASSGV